MQFYRLKSIFIWCCLAVLITNVITRLLPYDDTIWFSLRERNLFILDLGWSLRILWFATSFQSWTLYFLFGVGFISRRLENFIVDTINIDGEKHLMLELMPFVGKVWRSRDTEMTNRSELLTRRRILKSILFASNVCDLVRSWL